MDLLAMIFEYRLLLAKEETLNMSLDDGERVRLVGVERMLQGDPLPQDRRRRMPRLPLPVAAQFTVPGGFGEGRIEDISAGGVALRTRTTALAGSRTILRVTYDGYEYVFPCRVVWSRRSDEGGKAAGMGLAFDGVPSCVRVARISGVLMLKSSLPLGAKRVEPMVA